MYGLAVQSAFARARLAIAETASIAAQAREAALAFALDAHGSGCRFRGVGVLGAHLLRAVAVGVRADEVAQSWEAGFVLEVEEGITTAAG